MAEHVGDYKDYYLLLIVKIGTTPDMSTNNVFRSKANVLDQWRQDPTSFTFEPTYLAIISLFDEEEKMIMRDGRH